MSPWTVDQILALAPDAGSAKAGKELAVARKWVNLGANAEAAWGECQGSARVPYQTQIDLREPAFKCSCPSRKFPCKHGLGLFLLLAGQPAIFRHIEPPAWVSDWLAKRSQKAEQPPKPSAQIAEKADPAAGQKAQAKRAAQRAARVAQGLEELQRWLNDLTRQGLASAQGQPDSFWEAPAARLVDAQAPGLARRVRQLAAIPASGEGWQGRLLEQAGRLHLAIEGYRRLENLPPENQADVRSVIGWAQDQDELLLQAGRQERWLVLGRRVEEEALGALTRASMLKIQRTWLWGLDTHRPALVLHFATPGQPLDASLPPGTQLEAELVYFPGAFPLRAVVKQRAGTGQPAAALPGYADWQAATAAYAAALAANPWVDTFPLALEAAVPRQNGEKWGLCDPAGRWNPLSPDCTFPWQLFALSGGHPLAVFGEYDGDFLYPLSACTQGRWINLERAR